MVAQTNPMDEAERQVEERADDLIAEFRQHYEAYVEQHPEKARSQRVIFEGWAIQKIAGLQLCVEHMAEQFNLHVKGKAKP